MLSRLFNKGFFRNATLEQGAAMPGVKLGDAVRDSRAVGFVKVKCESCGGTTRIRAGTVGACEYCGSPIREKTE